jgi:hypothetical protein
VGWEFCETDVGRMRYGNAKKIRYVPNKLILVRRWDGPCLFNVGQPMLVSAIVLWDRIEEY